MTTFWVTPSAAAGAAETTDEPVVLPFAGSVTKRIYMAVNESALLSVTGAGGIYDATWQRDQKRLLQIKDNIVKYYVTRDQCRCTVFLNGTLQIERVVKEDSGKYTVTVYHPDGKLKVEEDTMFIVQGEFLLFPCHSQHSWEFSVFLLSPTAFPTCCPPFWFGGGTGFL